MSRGVIVLVFVALAAGAVGFVIGRGSPEEAPAPNEPPPEERPEEHSRRPGPAQASPPISPGEIDELLASTDPDLPSPVDEAIEGSVRTEDGQPVPGVLVRAVPRWGGGRPDRGSTLREKVVQFIRRVRFQDALTRETRTGTDGGYALRGLVDATYQVTAEKPGYRIWTQNAPGGRPGSRVEFRARSVARLAVRVLAPDGSPAKEAQVAHRPYGKQGGGSHGWTPKNAEVTLQPGRWELRASAGEGGELASDWEEVQITDSKPPPGLTLRLRERPGIRGRLILEEGGLERSIFIACIPRTGGAEPEAYRFHRARHRQWLHQGSDLGYSFIDIEPGDYRIAALEGRRILVHADVTVESRMVVCDLEIPDPEPGEYLVVHVLGPDGEPVPSSSFHAGTRSSHGNSSSSAQSQRRPDGSFRVTKHRDEDQGRADDATHYLRVTAPELGTREIVYDPEDSREITVRFETPATLHVTVAGYRGSGYEGLLSVSLERAREGDSSRASSVNSSAGSVDRDGRQTLGPFAPGDYEIGLAVLGDGYSRVRAATVPVTLVSGENRKTVTMPRLYALTVLTGDLPGGSSLTLSGLEPSRVWIRGQKPETGKLVFRGLPAGKYILRQSGRRDEQMTVVLPEQTVVRFKAEVVNALSVRIKNPDGIFGRAGLRTGDLIIGVNGQEFESLRQLYAIMLLESEKGPVKLLVLRGNVRSEVSVDLSGMLGGDVDSGADIQPTSR